MTEEQRAQILAALRLGMTRVLAARAAGVNPAEVEADFSFLAQIEQAEAKAELAAMARAEKAAQGGDKKAAAWLRQRRGKAPKAKRGAPIDGLSVSAARFADEYQGDGDAIRAARAAGAQGTNRSVSVTATRWLRLDGVQDRLRDRGIALPGESEARPAAGGPELDVSSPEAFHRAIAADTTLPLRDRQRSMERLEQIERRAAPDTDAEARLAALRVKIAEELRKMSRRARERATPTRRAPQEDDEPREAA